MGLRCLLGHDFGEPELRRTREEQGDEVIITVSEVTTCRRCGATRIVGENKEITSIEQLAATAADPADGQHDQPAAESARHTAQPTTQQPTTAESTATAKSSPTADTNTAATTANASPSTAQPAGGSSPADEDTEILHADAQPSPDVTHNTADDTAAADPTDEQPTRASTPEDADTAGGDTGYAEFTTASTAADDEPETEATEEDGDGQSGDDGIILPSDKDDTEREVGAWPAYDAGEDDATGSEPTPWPEQTGEDTGYDASTPNDDGDLGGGSGFVPDIADAESAFGDAGVDTTTQPSVSEKSVETEAEQTVDDAELLDADESATGPAERGQSRAADIGDEMEFEATVDDIETEFVCPACGFSRESGVSWMRAGDICPECKRGYIAEQPLDD